MPAGHALSNRNQVSLEDLRREQLVLPTSELTTRSVIDLALKKAGIRLDKTPFEASSRRNLLLLVVEGLGVGVYSGAAVPLSSQLVFRPLEDPTMVCNFSIAWWHHGRRAAAVEAFRQFAETWEWPAITDATEDDLRVAASVPTA
jgi:DNA-binding transcriptional LysR family regulator